MSVVSFSMGRVWLAGAASGLAALAPGPRGPPALEAQIARSVPPPGAVVHTAPLAERYEAEGFKRWLLGGGYRDVWGTPVPIPVLDLEGTAGGLTPVETGGYGQTVTLEFLGADGLEYAVRSIDKVPTRRLDPLLQGTVVASIVQDQVSAFLPTAGVVVDPILDAAGLLYPRHELVVIPDDPALGPFREEFRGLIGMFVDRPQEGENDTPGFAGSTRIVDTDRMLEHLEEDPCHRAEVTEYLKARLIDHLIGDRDRHPGQWRWARFPDGPDCFVWRTIPEDRDQAFIDADGFMMWVFRRISPRQIEFAADYPNLIGLSFNAWELDRHLLAELDRSAWQTVAEELQSDITDEVITSAVGRLPEAHFELVGAELIESLRSRRDALVDFALDYYHLISGDVEITATDRPERAVFEHLPDGRLDLTLTLLDAGSADGAGEPAYRRTFLPDETDEVRIYLQGGDDEVVVRGERGGIRIRAIGGGGDDRFENRAPTPSSRARFYDDRGQNAVAGRVQFDDRPYERPPASNLVHQYALDWGSMRRLLPSLSLSPDIGLFLGAGVAIDRYGFRKSPWSSSHTLQLGAASSGPDVFAAWSARVREAAGAADLTAEASFSGIEILRFHGFGNGSVNEGDDDFFKVETSRFRFAPTIEWALGNRAGRNDGVMAPAFRPRFRVGFGPVLQWTDVPADDNADRFIGSLDPTPLGVGQFGQLGFRGHAELDGRDDPGYPTRGVRLSVEGSLFPAVWDVRDVFGRAGVTGAVYLTPGTSRGLPTLALRAGAERAWGEFPFHEAAFLGGRGDVRGLLEKRFAGDASVFGNAELRLPVARFSVLLPGQFGLHAAADAGRVYVDDLPDESGELHASFGGGIWLSLLDRAQVISLSVMHGDDLTGFYLRAGMHF